VIALSHCTGSAYPAEAKSCAVRTSVALALATALLAAAAILASGSTPLVEGPPFGPNQARMAPSPTMSGKIAATPPRMSDIGSASRQGVDSRINVG
jgi:hypothetical protein